MELRHLRYFAAAAEHENFHRAATLLHVAAPSLSRRIRDLEIELGFDLFIRDKKRVRLSPAGATYLVHVKHVMETLRIAKEQSRRTAEGTLGNLNLGFNETALYHNLFKQSLLEFRTHYPDIELRLDPLMPSQLYEGLIDESIDAAISYDISFPLQDARLDSLTIAHSSYLLAMRDDNPLARRAILTLGDLVDEPFVWLRREASPKLHDRLLALAEGGGLAPKIVQHAINPSSRLQLVSVGLGVAFVMDSFIGMLPANVTLRRVDDFSYSTALSIFWQRNRSLPALERFISRLKELALG